MTDFEPWVPGDEMIADGQNHFLVLIDECHFVALHVLHSARQGGVLSHLHRHVGQRAHELWLT